MKISELIDSIRNRNLVLPEIQREYVWSREQAKQLMVSLVRDYPVGSLLFWKTDDPPALKNLDELPEKLGAIQVILDGQQRLTVLYMLIAGEIPPYYIETDIQNDFRKLYYNLETGKFQYYLSSQMKDNPLWRRVIDCFDKGINIFEIAKQQATSEQKALNLAQRYNENLNKLQNVRSVDLPVQSVPSDASLGDAIDIFDRVNSQGTKLTDAELALTHVTGAWPQARRTMKNKIEELSQLHFSFDLTFMTRALTGVVTQHALFQTIHARECQELKQGWTKLEKILDYLVSILPEQAFIHSTEDLNTTNVLVPLIVYLSLHEGKFPGDMTLKHAIHWLYAAHAWSRYTAQTDQRLEHDCSLIIREQIPWDELRDQIIDQRGRIKVKGNDIEGRGVRHPLFRMTFILAKAHGAIDWFNGVPLGTPHGQSYQIHKHHIFPQSVLYKSDYDPDNHLHRKIVNEIANRAFLTAKTNLNISARLPEKYLPEVEENFPGSLSKQFIPIDPVLWKLENFSDFLEARRELIARKINEFMESLIGESLLLHKRPIGELISLGESATLEFKSTLQWDVIQNRINKNLRHSVLKTIAAFLNSEGGTLVIGVEDNGHIYSLGNDLKTFNGSSEQFEKFLFSLVNDHIGSEYISLLKIRFEKIEGKRVCAIDVNQAPEPAFLEGPRGSEFYVRMESTSRVLNAEEARGYIQMNFQ